MKRKTNSNKNDQRNEREKKYIIFLTDSMWKFIEGKGLKIFIKYEFIGKKLDIVDNFMDNDSLEKNC